MPAASTHKSGGGWVIFGLVTLGAYEAYKHFVKPDIVTPIRTAQYVERMKIGKMTGIKFHKDMVEFKFPIENPNTEPMVIKAIVADVFVDTPKGVLKLGQIAHYGTDVIKPVAATNFDLAVKINLLNEFTLLSNAFQGNWRGMTLIVKGTVTANNRPWPVNESISIT